MGEASFSIRRFLQSDNVEKVASAEGWISLNKLNHYPVMDDPNSETLSLIECQDLDFKMHTYCRYVIAPVIQCELYRLGHILLGASDGSISLHLMAGAISGHGTT